MQQPTRAAALVLFSLLLGACQPSVQIASTGSSVGSGSNLLLTGGGHYFTTGSPGIIYGTLRLGKSPRALTYVVVIEGAATTIANVVSGSATMRGKHGQTVDELNIDGIPTKIDYEVDIDGLDTDQPTIKSATLKVGKEALDISKGRVILIKNLGGATRIEQIDVDLPAASVLDTGGLEKVSTLADSVLKSVRASAPGQDFLK